MRGHEAMDNHGAPFVQAWAMAERERAGRPEAGGWGDGEGRENAVFGTPNSMDRWFFTRGPWWTVSRDPVDRCFSHVDRGGPHLGTPWTVVFSRVDRGGP